jgi:competence protein ComFC
MRQMRKTVSHCRVLISGFLNILYPSLCPVCGKPSDSWRYSPVCSECWSQTGKYRGPACRVCALPLSSEYSSVCGQCIKEKPQYSKALFFGLYDGVLAEAINQLKFHGLKRLSKPLGRFLLDVDLPPFDGIVPVPLSLKGLRQRGFNQSLLLAIVVSRHFKAPLLMDILSKKKETPPQIGLSKKERLYNLRNAFETKGDIESLRLLLIDDVMTTGATANECSRMLMKAGAKEVIVLTLARASMM